jgi:glycosyltransferase involved in cell wall biosynthesis
MSNTEKFAIYLPSLAGGGAERSMVNLAIGMSQQPGVQVDLVLAEASGPYMKSVPSSIRIVDLKAGRVMQSLLPLSNYLRSERPKGMVAAMDHANLVAIWAKRLSGAATNIVACMQNTVSQDANNAANTRGRFIPMATKWFYPWATGVVGVSQGVVDDFVKLTGVSKNVMVIHNPVVTPELFSRAEEPVDHPWLQEGQKPVLMGVGRLTKQKDFPNLISAFAEVRKQHDVRLMILGEGELRGELEQLIAQLGLQEHVALPGFASNPYAYMRRARMFVLSSLWEGLPTVLIEAMAVGTSVVATDCPSGPQEILKGGKLGRLVSISNHKALAEAISKTLDETRQPANPDHYRDYTQAVVVEKYLKLLRGGL